MTRLLLSAAFALVSVIALAPSASPALACSGVRLMGDGGIRTAESDAVFTGTVVARSDAVGIGASTATFTFAVDAVQKGSVGSRVEATSSIGPNCDSGLAIGGRYRVYADDIGGKLMIMFGNVDRLPALADPPPPDPVDTGIGAILGSQGDVLVGIAAAIAFGVVLVVAFRNPRRGDAPSA